ncbi:hypothetical protein HDE_04709 [Halotydeus destructor]|nr:hypothetical protein HDE_04709 [Halotydeus destructor]
MKETQSIIQAYQFQTAQLKHLITGLRKENAECRRVELQRRLERQQQFLTPALSSATHLTPETPANGFGNNATAPGSNSSNKICLPSFPAPKRKTPAAATQQNGQVANGVTSRISMSNASGQRQMMSQGSQNGRYSSYSNQPAQPMSVVPQSATQIRTINDAQQYGYQTPNNRTLMEMSQQKSIIGVNSDRITLKPRLSNSFQSPSVAQMMPNMSQQGTQNYNGLNSTPTSYPHSMTSSTMRGKKTTPRAEVPPYQQQGNHNYRKL